MDSDEGPQLGRYRFVRELGRGNAVFTLKTKALTRNVDVTFTITPETAKPEKAKPTTLVLHVLARNPLPIQHQK